MSPAFNTIYAAIVSDDPDLLTILRDNWKCLLGPDEKKLIKVLRGGGGGSVDGSEGGFGVADAGKVPLFGANGSLALSNTLTIYKGDGHTPYWQVDVSNVTDERNIGVLDSPGVIPLWNGSAGVAPANSGSAGFNGTMFYDNDFLYVCVADATWRRVDLSIF